MTPVEWATCFTVRKKSLRIESLNNVGCTQNLAGGAICRKLQLVYFKNRAWPTKSSAILRPVVFHRRTSAF